MSDIRISAGERVRVVRKNFSSVPGTIEFDARGADGTAARGVVEVCGSNWVFPKSPTTQALAPSNSVPKGFWDTFFSIYVIPENDIIVAAPAAHSHRWCCSLASSWASRARPA